MAREGRFKGDGSCTFRGHDKHGVPIYEVTVYGGFNPVKRRYDKRTRRVHGTKADAMRARDELKAEIEGGIIRGADSELFHDFAWAWLEKRATDGEVSQSTIDSNRHALAVLDGYIGKCRLKDITPVMVDSLYGAIRKDQGYSGSTMKQIHTALRHVMSRAVDLGYVMANPLDRVKAPKAGENNRKSLDFEQVARLRARVGEAWAAEVADFEGKEQRRNARGGKSARSYVRDVRPLSCVIAVLLGLATGARRGEVLALTWADVDLERETVRIGKTITDKMEIKAPKTKAGIRTIAIDSDTARMLSEWRERQRGILALLCQIQGSASPVCIGSTGGYLEPHNFSNWWRRFRASIGFDGLRFHELRHTQATVLLSEHVDVKTVSARLGHSSASITLDMYAHAMPETDREAARMMGEVLGRGGVPDGVVKIA